MLASLVRTLVPLVVGYLLGSPVAGLLQDAGVTEAHLTTLATVLVTAVYYVVVRLAEEHLQPQFGWLLGLAKRPTYRSDLDLAA